jgi:hypothetical protein
MPLSFTTGTHPHSEPTLDFVGADIDEIVAMLEQVRSAASVGA